MGLLDELLGIDTSRSTQERILNTLKAIERKIDNMAVAQAEFDTDLEALITAQTGYITAVQGQVAGLQAQVAALQAGQTPPDLSTEDAEVQTAEQALATALAAVNPTAAPSASAAVAALKKG